MKHIILVLCLLSLVIASCSEKVNEPATDSPDLSVSILNVPDTIVDKDLLVYDNTLSEWKLNDKLYSGYAVSHYADGSMKEKIGFVDGRKQNQETQWFPDNHIKRTINYHQGKLHGTKKSWSPDMPHVLISKLNYVQGKAHGEQVFWYPTGELYKKLHLNMGAEEGMQQAFRKTGELYANYEAKEGRIFGLKKAALCYGLEDENLKYEN